MQRLVFNAPAKHLRLCRPIFEQTVRILRIDLSALEFKTQVSLEYLILIERIDADVAISPGAKCVVDLPGIGVGGAEDYGISQHIPGSHSHALQAQLAVEEI